MKQTRMIIDPPGGWRYGFPKPYNPNPGETFRDWLIREGFPAIEVDWAMQYIRSWEAEGDSN